MEVASPLEHISALKFYLYRSTLLTYHYLGQERIACYEIIFFVVVVSHVFYEWQGDHLRPRYFGSSQSRDHER